MANDLIDAAIRIAKRHGAPPGWVPWLFQSALNGVVCTGAVCPPITRGKNKGQPNYRKADPDTKSMVFLPGRFNK